MPDFLVDFLVTYTDSEGETSNCLGHKLYDVRATLGDIQADGSEFATLINALTTNTVQSVSAIQRTYLNLHIPGGFAEFANSEDKALLCFRSTVAGGQYTIKIPAPRRFIFKSDGETINPAYAPVQLFTDWVIANLVTKEGRAGLSFTTGQRIRKRSRKERPGVSTARG